MLWVVVVIVGEPVTKECSLLFECGVHGVLVVVSLACVGDG